MIRKVVLISQALTLSACGLQHGGPDSWVASADFPFQPALAGEITKESKAFAAQNGFSFRQEAGEGQVAVELKSRELTIVTRGPVDRQRLKIVAVGLVTPTTIKVANRYTNQLGSIH